MKITFQPPIPGQAGHSRLFGLAEWRPGREAEPGTIFLNGRRLLVLLAILVSLGWFGGAAAVWQLMRYHDYHSVGYFDTVLPWRWRQIPLRQADDLMLLAHRQTLQTEYLKALWNAKAAIRKDPRRLDSYELIGLICARHWLMADARSYLQQGLDQGEPTLSYLQLTLEVAQISDDPETVLQLTDRYWKSGWRSSDPASRMLLASQRAQALLQLKRWAEALAWTQQLRQQKEQPIVLVDVEAYALLQLGRPKEARSLLANLPIDFAKQHSGIIRLMAEVYHNTGDMKAFRLSMQYYLQQGGNQPARYLDIMGYCLDQPDLLADFNIGLEAYYEKFGTQEDVMGTLAEFLLRHNSLHELARLYQYAQSHMFLPGLIDIAYAQSLLFAGREDDAATVLNRLPKYPENSPLGTRVTLLRRLMNSRATDLSKAAVPLTDFITAHPLPLDDTLSLVDLLSRRGQYDDAGRILDAATRNYAHSQRLNDRIERFHADRKALREATGPSGEKP